MSDLTKLTAEELLGELYPHIEVHPACGDCMDEWGAEIRRRMDRLEQCEALIRECFVCSRLDAARAALEGK